MWVEPNEAFCGDARAEWRPPKRDAIVYRQPYSTLCGMFVQPFFSWIEFDDFSFYFQKTYNSRLRERYEDDPSIHSDFNMDLWIEVGSSDGPDKN